MTKFTFRSRTSVIALLLVTLGATERFAAQENDTGATRFAPRIELDRAALVIDVAAERRALHSSIRRELARRVGERSERDPSLATLPGQPRG